MVHIQQPELSPTVARRCIYSFQTEPCTGQTVHIQLPEQSPTVPDGVYKWAIVSIFAQGRTRKKESKLEVRHLSEDGGIK